MAINFIEENITGINSGIGFSSQKEDFSDVRVIRKDVSNTIIIGNDNSVGVEGGETQYADLYGTMTWDGDSDIGWRPTGEGELTQWRINVKSNSCDDTTVFTITKQGTATGFTISVPAGETGIFTCSDIIEWVDLTKNYNIKKGS